MLCDYVAAMVTHQLSESYKHYGESNFDLDRTIQTEV